MGQWRETGQGITDDEGEIATAFGAETLGLCMGPVKPMICVGPIAWSKKLNPAECRASVQRSSGAALGCGALRRLARYPSTTLKERSSDSASRLGARIYSLKSN
jgi:hypothetical protein